ncbi:hypothetical protein [Streptomyces sp. UNOB3_S3]|uniref:hypothetical protein n=1 Tax=Streptomyces sp. UNOB3_S3 TaxID=2871682 RepID=UPI001E4789C3|nr:hypothetical protein [Streptomyces sp. UNOB3_S3]MCC3778456.1 hypothetical protein [Streptomyces sp. UNOB3_S3]
MDDKAESEAKDKGKRLELSVAQVAGSALAAVVAAMLAGKLGVYGTVIGAGVVSVVATTGGTVFQHLFKRTGEQIREAATQPEPRLRQVPVRDASRAVDRARSADAATTVLPAAGPARDGGPDPARTQLLGQVDATGLPPGTEDRTQLLHQVSHPGANPAQSEAYAGARTGAHDDAYIHGYSEDFSQGTTHGTRLRGWKRPLLAAAAVFALAMGTVTVVELLSGASADGDKGGTTVSRIFQPGRSEKKDDPAPQQEPDPGRSHGGSEVDTGDGGPTPSPDASKQGGGTGGKPTPDPTPTPSSGGGTPKPTPTPDSGSSPDAGKGGTDGKGGTGGQGSGGTGGQSPSPQPPGQNAAAGTSAGSGTGTTS